MTATESYESLQQTDLTALPSHLLIELINSLSQRLSQASLEQQTYDKERRHRDMNVPAADAALYRPEAPDSGTLQAHGEAKALRARFTNIWRFGRNRGVDVEATRKIQRREFLNLGGSDIVMGPSGEWRQLYRDGARLGKGVDTWHPEESIGLREVISSQLLLYRLASIFGLPPTGERYGYRGIWNVCLDHSDRQSSLRFKDFMGSVSCYFLGTRKAFRDVLKLLEFLTSSRWLHTYDGLAAGIAL